jgi:TolB-like protein/Tfp pilus assembly protein PilF
MTGVSSAVFLSYASDDTEAAERIATALRSAGIEAWFDKSELRGGDAWDRRIRDQIHDCRLLIAVISAHTEARDEGYFRREWRLAVERVGDMHDRKAFIVPVVIDETSERGAAVPEKFRELQWARLPGGETPAAFVDQIKRLLSSEPLAVSRSGVSRDSAVAADRARPARILKRPLWVAAALAVTAVAAYFAYERFWAPRTAEGRGASPAAAVGPAAAAFNPPPHSVAVLPFVNMSGDKEQEYFSDGLSEELLNDLARVSELQVAARTSAFSFKGRDTDIGTIARKLNVGAVLEGSVRRSGHTLRVTAQLINAVSGFHVWSQTYDRSLGDVLKLQTEIAAAVAGALKVTLLDDIAARVELGGTQDPVAFDAYLRGLEIARLATGDQQARDALAAFSDAIHHDPQFATAFAERSVELTDFAIFNAHGPQIRASFDAALADAHTALRLAPDLALGHFVLAVVLERGFLQLTEASRELDRALELAPGSARIVASYSRRAAELQHTDAALSAGRRAITLDPLNFHVHRTIGIALLLARRYPEAAAAFQTAISLRTDYPPNHVLLGEARYGLGDFEGARAECEIAAATSQAQLCLAKVYRKLGRHADAAQALRAAKSAESDDGAFDFARVYAQWGDIDQALGWLEVAMRRREPDLADLKAEPDLDPLRGQPRFQAIERELKFPD